MGNPYDKPQTAIGAMYQMSLGQMGYHTGSSANYAGLEQRRLETARKQQKKPRQKSWWETDTSKK